MALQDTNLLVQAAKLPATFEGSPQDWADALVKRMKIVSPNGTNFIFIGDVEPTSNVGPWLRDGTKWYVFDPNIKRYVPLDISDSETKWFSVGASTPITSDPPVWLRTTKDQTEADPSIGSPIGWYIFNGAGWVPFLGIVTSGNTQNRPANPVEFQQYYDSDISALIWWERGDWRTVSGIPGDVKFVAYNTLDDALTHNPGWILLGAGNANLRGRYLLQAAANADGSDPLTVSPNVAVRKAFETFGETDGVKIDGTSPVPYPPSLALWTLVKT
jgi:hypothetical protein